MSIHIRRVMACSVVLLAAACSSNRNSGTRDNAPADDIRHLPGYQGTGFETEENIKKPPPGDLSGDRSGAKNPVDGGAGGTGGRDDGGLPDPQP